jgi:drug/metabolite transporter (DMT)-like permease
MMTRNSIDKNGAAILIGFSLLLAFNQVVIKITNAGFQPVFQAGLRSMLAIVPLMIWMWWKRIPILPQPRNFWPSLLIGGLFAGEFLCLFSALDLTTVGRVSILFYSMPIWLAIAAHFLLPGERLSRTRAVGLTLAIAGVAWAVFDRDPARTPSLMGDLLALGAAMGWGGIALTVRLSRLSREAPETQLLAQLVISGPILVLVGLGIDAPFRDVTVVSILGLTFQTLAVAFFGFLLWFKLVSKYSASGVASFSFLSPVFSVILGALLLGEGLHFEVLVALALVAVGLVLINKKG